MPADDSLILRMRAYGAQTTAAGVRGVASSVSGLESATARANRSVSRLATGMRVVVGIGLAEGFRRMATAGWNYNQMLDRQRVGFTTYLRSAQKADVFMRRIQRLALESPVLDPQTTGEGARMLMAYGVAAKDALPWVKALGDMSAASGRSIMDVLPRGALAIGQIRSKGKLQAQELRQLAESVGLDRRRVVKELHMTTEEFEESFKPGRAVTSGRALKAIRRAMQKQAEGAAERLSKTTEGRIQRFKEVANRGLADLERGLYQRAGLLAGGLANRLQGIWSITPKAMDPLTGSGGELTMGQKLAESWRLAKPLLQKAIQDLDIGGKLVAATEWAGPRAAKAFINAFVNAPWWAQVAGGAWLLTKLGITGKLARTLAGGGAGKAGLGALLQRGSPGNPMYVVVMAGGTGVPGVGGPGGRRGLPPAFKTGVPIVIGAAAVYLSAKAVMDPGNKTLAPRLKQRGMAPPLVGRYPGAARQLGNRGELPVPHRPGGGATAAPGNLESPLLPKSAQNPVLKVYLDGKEIAHNTRKHTRKDKSTR